MPATTKAPWRRIAMEVAFEAVDCPACGSKRKEAATPELAVWHDPDGPRFRFSRCRECALVYLDPRPRDPSACYVAGYRKHKTKGRKRNAFRAGSRRLLARLFLGYPPKLPELVAAPLRRVQRRRWEEYAAKHPHLLVPWAGERKGRLLDIGSGAGDKAIKYAELGWKVTGVEPGAEAARLAREIHGLDVRPCRLEDAGFPAGSFDAVTANCVFEHLPNPRVVLKEIHRVLAPGGALALDIPNFESGLREALGACWTHYSFPFHIVLPTEATMRALVEGAGFRVEKVLHRCSLALYQAGVDRARMLGTLDPALPADDKGMARLFRERCAAPNGDLIWMQAVKE